MERDPLRPRPEPLTEEKGQRGMNASERVRQPAEPESNAAQTIARGAEKVSEQAHIATSKANAVLDQATDKAHTIADQLRSTNLDDVHETLHEKQQELSAQADTVMTATGQRMEELAATLRQKAPEGRAHDIALQAADVLERGGHYLERSTPATVRQDLETIIRKHPIETLIAGVGAGFLLARACRRR